jgi:hypothetical protein
MAIDIVAHMEVLLEIEQRYSWCHYSVLNLPRNYQFFDEICSFEKPSKILNIGDCRGFPRDVTTTTYFDLRTFASRGEVSWISSKEYCKVFHLYDYENYKHWCHMEVRHPACLEQHLFGLLFGTDYSRFHDDDDLKGKGVNDFRMIFSFN